MPYLNNYVPPPQLEVKPWHLDTPAEEYDLNFVWPVPERLSTPGGVLLVPLIPSQHAATFLAAVKPYPDLLQFVASAPPLNSIEMMCTVLEKARRDPGTLVFAVFDQSLEFDDHLGEGDETRAERLAGTVGIEHASEQNRSAEVGWVFTLPPFQRSHVTTHATALILRHLLSTLQLRRAGWVANALNLGSQRAAARLGFVQEAHLRWAACVPLPGKASSPLEGWEEEEEARGRGADGVLLSVTWEEWRRGGRERVEGLLGRDVGKRRLGAGGVVGSAGQ